MTAWVSPVRWVDGKRGCGWRAGTSRIRLRNPSLTSSATSRAQAGQEALQASRHGAGRAVLVVDGYLRLNGGRTDALIVDAVEYGPARRSLKIGVPYRPQPNHQGFAVHRPKFPGSIRVNRQDYPALTDPFSAG